MNSINETSLPNKEDFYNYLNMEDITDIKDMKKEYLRN